MVFSSLIFLFAFLPLCLVCYYYSPDNKVRNAVLVAFSAVFYAWGEPVWVSLLLGSALVDYWNGRFICHFRGTRWAVLGVVSTLVFNLGILATFKYSDFLIQNLNEVAGTDYPQPHFVLPIGISFYTFLTISYTIDVYRGEVQAARTFLNYLVYICNFHHLVAGPIIRYGHIAKEITERVFSSADFASGVTRFCRGLFKKVCIANLAGELAVQFLDGDMGGMTVAGAWFGLTMFAIQIYFDFSGYSDMAIGLGRIFGFHYHENFRHPYIATTMTDFWRRWHISLGSFFRDYVYIPMGGNRRRFVLNLFVVWALTGLWHGASWNFVLWGLYFGVILLVEKAGLAAWMERWPWLLRHGYAKFLILIGWALFYFTDLDRLTQFFRILFGATGQPISDYAVMGAVTGNLYWLALALIACLPLYGAIRRGAARVLPEALVSFVEIPVNAAFFLLSVTLLVNQSYNPFIYFRF